MQSARLAGLILLSAGICSGQSAAKTAPDAPSQSIKQSASIGWPNVVVNVLFDSKAGKGHTPALVDLSSLRIVDDGTPQKIQTIVGPGTPVSLCLDLDISGSMQSKRNFLRDAAITLIKNLPPGSEVMISVFADKSYLPIPFTPASEVDLSIFDRLTFAHHTALYDSIVTAESYFVHTAHFRRRAFVMITDGLDNLSGHSAKDAVRSLETPQSPFFYVIQTLDPYVPYPWSHLQAGLFLLPAGVHVVTVVYLQDIPRYAELVSEWIATQYALAYTSTSASQNKRLHKIEVELDPANSNVKVELLRGYYLPTP